MKCIFFIPIFAFMLCNSAFSAHFHGAIDTLFWKPIQTPIAVGRRTVLIAEDSGPREDLLLKPDSQWGVQAELGYLCNNQALDFNYTYFCSCNKEDYDLDGFPTLRIPGGETADNLQFISASTTVLYQKGDLRYAQFLDSCCSQFYIYTNVRWTEIKLENLDLGKREQPGPFTDSYDQASRFSAGGLGFGLGGSYELGQGLSVVARGGLMGLIGNLKMLQTVYISESEEALILKPQSYTIMTPALDFRLGIGHFLPACLCTLEAEIGYQMDYYFDVTRHNMWVGAAEDDTVQLNAFNQGFGGFYFRLAAYF